MLIIIFIQIFIYSFLIVSVYLSNSCETIDDLQFDNLGLRGQIDSLMTRVTALTEEIVEQKNLTKTKNTKGKPNLK